MEIGRNGKGGRKKSSYWTRAMAWLQQLAPDVTMKLLINISKYIQIHEGSLVRLPVVFRRSEEPREALLGEAGELR